MFVTSSLTQDLVIIGVTLLVTILAFFKWRYQYWKRLDVDYFKPRVPFGNLPNSMNRKEHICITLKRFFDQASERGWKYFGLYFLAAPVLVPVDLDLLKNILTKDFQYFTDRGSYYNEEDDPLSAHLVAIGGEKWRNLRTKVTPTFTSGKMKMMFQTLVDCEENLQTVMEKFYKSGEPIDIKEVLACFTTDVIGSCAFGLDCKSFEDENSPFRMYGRKVFTPGTGLDFIRGMLRRTLPDVARKLHLRVTPKDISDFFIKVVRDNVEYREKNGVTRKDFMQLLIDLKNNKLAEEGGYKHDGKTLTIEEIAAQSFVFFLAGFETSSTAMTFALYELSRHQDIQDRLRQEIKQVLAKHDKKITYEALHDMKYLQQVLDETLRIYPPAPTVSRRCMKDYKSSEYNLTIEKGTLVVVPIYSIHHDKNHYPNPEEFDPERFTEENKQNRHQYAHIPFGEGPRICIGMRFGLMQAKVGLSSLLRDYRFFVDKKTQEPLKMIPNSGILTAQGDVWLRAEKI